MHKLQIVTTKKETLSKSLCRIMKKFHNTLTSSMYETTKRSPPTFATHSNVFFLSSGITVSHEEGSVAVDIFTLISLNNGAL